MKNSLKCILVILTCFFLPVVHSCSSGTNHNSTNEPINLYTASDLIDTLAKSDELPSKPLEENNFEETDQVEICKIEYARVMRFANSADTGP